MEPKGKAEQNMDRMIQKYKEEALKYQQKYHDLYPEQIPPVAVSVTKTPETKTDSSKASSEKIQPKTEVPPAPKETGNAYPIGDITYVKTPEKVEEILRQSSSDINVVEYTDTGYLQVEVTAADQAIPVPSAFVLVLRKIGDDTNLIWNLQTDISGNTPVVELPAPPEDLSERPEPKNIIPYGAYMAIVAHPQYYTTIVNDIQIFAGQTAILPVALIPLSEKDVNPSAENTEIETGKHAMLE